MKLDIGALCFYMCRNVTLAKSLSPIPKCSLEVSKTQCLSFQNISSDSRIDNIDLPSEL